MEIEDDSFITGRKGLLSQTPLSGVLGYHTGKNLIGIIGVLFVMGSMRAIYLADKRASESAQAKRIRNHELEKAEEEIRSIKADDHISKMEMVAIDITELPKVKTPDTGDHGELDEEVDDCDLYAASSSQAETNAPDESSDEELRRFIDEIKTRRGIVDDDDSPG